MHRKRLRWQLFPSYLLITALSLGAVIWIAAGFLRSFSLSQILTSLESKARLVEPRLQGLLTPEHARELQAAVPELSRRAVARITVILPTGKIAADSHEDPLRMDNHLTRPEVYTALHAGRGTSRRFSYTLRKRMIYLAVPLRRDGRVAAVLRLAIPAAPFFSALRHAYFQFAVAGLIIISLAGALSFWVSTRLSLPLEDMKTGAERFARGDFQHKLLVSGSAEAATLADSLNQMAAQLDERIRAGGRQQHELQAILASMSEGVLAVDLEGRLLRLNLAASRLLGIDASRGIGRPLPELIRNSQLQHLVDHILESAEPAEQDIVLPGEPDCYLQVRGSVLRDMEDRGIGAVIVLNDVTRLKRLENVRRDFVANVSHELKTPVTLIQGFVETLQEGALAKPEDARRFLDIMSKQSARLNTIIDDLLTLSRIEQDAERGEIPLELRPLRPVLLAVVNQFRSAAEAKHIRLELDCPESIRVPMNERLLEQALGNLVDNAVKYSEPDREVRLTASVSQSEIVLAVADQGPGIATEHLPRLFERFYRVDKSRSRDSGGSGLGLSIVKHILNAHGGTVHVDSTPGRGSVFSLRLPASPPGQI